jgi:hypothetical protein
VLLDRNRANAASVNTWYAFLFFERRHLTLLSASGGSILFLPFELLHERSDTRGDRRRESVILRLEIVPY